MIRPKHRDANSHGTNIITGPRCSANVTLKNAELLPIVGKIWTNPATGLQFLITFLTQWLGLSKIGLKQPSIF